LREYVLVDSEAVNVEVFRINENGHWQLDEHKKPDEFIQINAVDFQLTLKEIYLGTKLS